MDEYESDDGESIYSDSEISSDESMTQHQMKNS